MKINPLKLARVRKLFTVRTVADKLGVHIKTVWRWENGAKLPTLPNLHAVADLLETDPGELYADMHVWREERAA